MSTFNFLPANQGGQCIVARILGVANAAGGGAGASVNVNVTFGNSGDGVTPIWPPATTQYAVVVSPSQNCFWTVGSKTATGFTVTLTPTSGTVTLAAGSFDVIFVA